MPTNRRNPPLPIQTNQAYKLVVRGRLFGQTTINVFYAYDLNAANPALSQSGLNAMAQDWFDMMKPTYLACISGDWELVDVLCYSMQHPELRPGNYVPTPGTIVGLHAGDADTSWIAARVRRITAVSGQRGVGNVRLPGVPTSQVVGNGFDAAYRTKLIAFAAAMLLNIPSSVNPAVTLATALAKIDTYGIPSIVRSSLLVETEAATYAARQVTRRTREVS